MAELRLSIDLDKVPDGRWRAELIHVLRTTAEQLDSGWYPTPNELSTALAQNDQAIGGWAVVLHRDPLPSGQGVLCNHRAAPRSVHLCDEPAGHSRSPHRCRCGMEWPRSYA